MKTEVLVGIHPVTEALAARRRTFHTLYVQKGRTGVDDLKAVAKDQGIGVKEVEAAFFRDHPPGHQGVAARVSPYPAADFDDVVQDLGRQAEPAFVLAGDRIADPQNLGALIRTALCAGVHAVVLPDRHSAPLSSAVSKASAGALEHMTVARVPNLARALDVLKNQGLWVFGTDAGADTLVWRADLSGPVVLVVGSEQKGARRLTREHCDMLVKIPQQGAVASLNASAAGAVAMYEVVRQRAERD